MTLRAIPSSSDTSIWVRPHSSRRIILPLSESPLNLEVIPDAPAIDTERRKSEIEIGSKVCLSNFDAEISVLTLSNTSHNQEEWIQISSSPMNRDDSDVVKQTFSRFDPGLCTFRMTDAHCTSTGNIEENLIRFLAVTETAGEYLTNTILEELEKNGLDNHDCRGQGYDNGANMGEILEILSSTIDLQKGPQFNNLFRFQKTSLLSKSTPSSFFARSLHLHRPVAGTRLLSVLSGNSSRSPF
ncbi:hypothetical protein TNCV_141402 [Trichonephila clavipes]|nr:hypothetical protein TNCV_141402 [Trichonephila clavipes]